MGHPTGNRSDLCCLQNRANLSVSIHLQYRLLNIQFRINIRVQASSLGLFYDHHGNMSFGAERFRLHLGDAVLFSKGDRSCAEMEKGFCTPSHGRRDHGPHVPSFIVRMKFLYTKSSNASRRVSNLYFTFLFTVCLTSLR